MSAATSQKSAAVSTVAQGPEQRRGVELVGEFSPAHKIALSKAVPKAVAEEARNSILVGVYPIGLKVAIVGDLEIRKDELRRERLDKDALLFAALSLLSDKDRKAVYAGIRLQAFTRAKFEAEIEVLKEDLPRHYAFGDTVPHLVVTRL